MSRFGAELEARIRAMVGDWARQHLRRMMRREPTADDVRRWVLSLLDPRAGGMPPRIGAVRPSVLPRGGGRVYVDVPGLALIGDEIDEPDAGGGGNWCVVGTYVPALLFAPTADAAPYGWGLDDLPLGACDSASGDSVRALTGGGASWALTRGVTPVGQGTRWWTDAAASKVLSWGASISPAGQACPASSGGVLALCGADTGYSPSLDVHAACVREHDEDVFVLLLHGSGTLTWVDLGDLSTQTASVTGLPAEGDIVHAAFAPDGGQVAVVQHGEVHEASIGLPGVAAAASTVRERADSITYTENPTTRRLEYTGRLSEWVRCGYTSEGDLVCTEVEVEETYDGILIEWADVGMTPYVPTGEPCEPPAYLPEDVLLVKVSPTFYVEFAVGGRMIHGVDRQTWVRCRNDSGATLEHRARYLYRDGYTSAAGATGSVWIYHQDSGFCMYEGGPPHRVGIRCSWLGSPVVPPLYPELIPFAPWCWETNGTPVPELRAEEALEPVRVLVDACDPVGDQLAMAREGGVANSGDVFLLGSGQYQVIDAWSYDYEASVIWGGAVSEPADVGEVWDAPYEYEETYGITPPNEDALREWLESELARAIQRDDAQYRQAVATLSGATVVAVRLGEDAYWEPIRAQHMSTLADLRAALGVPTADYSLVGHDGRNGLAVGVVGAQT
jgi:hypothetical protein